jgi:hypothetical protein
VTDTPDDPTTEIRSAIAEIRGEGRKVGAIHAMADAALVAVLTLLAVALVGIDPQVSLPAAVRERLAAATGRSLGGSVGAGRLAAGLLGVLTLAIQWWRFTRRPLVEQFEAANPAVTDRLRTARDAIADGADSVMARRLYAEVLDRLHRTSSWRLVRTRRLGVQVVLVLVIGVASVGAVTAGIGLDLGDGTTPTQREPADYEGLQDPDRILGEPEDVSAGDESLDARIDTSGEGTTGGNTSVTTAGSGGPDAPGRYDAQQAEYASSEAVENAALIREYNLRIREGDTE